MNTLQYVKRRSGICGKNPLRKIFDPHGILSQTVSATSRNLLGTAYLPLFEFCFTMGPVGGEEESSLHFMFSGGVVSTGFPRLSAFS